MSTGNLLTQTDGASHNILARMARSPLIAYLLLGGMILLEACALIVEARQKPFWIDEILTFQVSGLHPFARLWDALSAGMDGMPPAYYAIMQLTRLLPGDPEAILRLPSVVGYALTLFAVYSFARTRWTPLAGLAAVMLIMLTPFRQYGIEARSYALLVGCVAASGALWQRIDRNRFATPLFAAFLMLSVSLHYCAIVLLTAFGAAELTYSLLAKRVRWSVWLSFLLATSVSIATLPILLRTAKLFNAHFWAKPALRDITATYGYYLGIVGWLTAVFLVTFAVLFGAMALRAIQSYRSHDTTCDRSDWPDLVLVAGFLLYPALLVIIALSLHGGYTPRYGWPVIIGVALATVYFFKSLNPRISLAPIMATVLTLFVWRGVTDVWTLSHGVKGLASTQRTALLKVAREFPELPIIMDSKHQYFVADHYSLPELKSRLMTVTDIDMAVRLDGSDTVDRMTMIVASHIPLRALDLSELSSLPNGFVLVAAVGERYWTRKYLVEQHYHLDLIATDAESDIYKAEKDRGRIAPP